MKFHAFMNADQALELIGCDKKEFSEVAERFPITAKETPSGIEIDIIELCYGLRSMAIEKQMRITKAVYDFDSENTLASYILN